MFVLILLSCLITIIHSLDVSWLPSDPDGPLPLSSKYRAALGKLCTMISSGQTLPPDVNVKLPIIKKLCIKLQSSSAYSFDSVIPWEKFSQLLTPNMLITFVLAGISFSFINLVDFIIRSYLVHHTSLYSSFRSGNSRMVQSKTHC